MSRIAFLNPNATQAMIEDMVAIARGTCDSACHIVGYTNTSRPAAIKGAADAAASPSGLFDIAADARHEGADALVIGCFDDTGLTEMRMAQT